MTNLSARVILVEAADRLLRSFPLSCRPMRSASALGIEVLLNQSVEVYRNEGAFIGDMWVPSATVIWDLILSSA